MGGAAGHIKHLWENPYLNGEDLKNIFGGLQDGNIKAYEKVDGQNIVFSFKKNEILCARKPAHYLDNGASAIKLKDIKKYFNPNVPDTIRNTFYTVLRYLQNAIKTSHLKDFFDEGGVWISAEILDNDTVNIIPYYKNYIVIHEIFDENRNYNHAINIISNELNKRGFNTYEVRGPQEITINKTIEYKSHIDELLNFGGNEYSFGGLLEETFYQIFIDKYPDVSNDVIKDMALRWGFNDKSKNIRAVLQDVPEPHYSNLYSEDKSIKNWQTTYSYVIYELITNLGCQILNNITPNFTDIIHIESAKKEVFNKVDNGIKTLFPSIGAFPDAGNKYEKYLDMYLIEGKSGISAIEGIVFEYKEEKYKIQGVFPAILQIVWGAKDVKKKLINSGTD